MGHEVVDQVTKGFGLLQTDADLCKDAGEVASADITTGADISDGIMMYDLFYIIYRLSQLWCIIFLVSRSCYNWLRTSLLCINK